MFILIRKLVNRSGPSFSVCLALAFSVSRCWLLKILSLILLDFSCLPGGGVGLSRVDHALSLSVAFPVVRLAVYIQLSFV